VRRASMKDKTVAILESRVRDHIASLVRKYGGTPFSAPALAEIPDVDPARQLDGLLGVERSVRTSEVLGRGVVQRQILLPPRACRRVCMNASAVMRAAITPVPPQAPARRYRWSGSIADDAACDQADRAGDEGACERAHCSVSEPLLRLCGDRRAGYSRDRDPDRKRFIHVNPPSARYGNTNEDPCRPEFIAPNS
jgi:hypothetical protein